MIYPEVGSMSGVIDEFVKKSRGIITEYRELSVDYCCRTNMNLIGTIVIRDHKSNHISITKHMQKGSFL